MRGKRFRPNSSALRVCSAPRWLCVRLFPPDRPAAWLDVLLARFRSRFGQSFRGQLARLSVPPRSSRNDESRRTVRLDLKKERASKSAFLDGLLKWTRLAVATCDVCSSLRADSGVERVSCFGQKRLKKGRKARRCVISQTDGAARSRRIGRMALSSHPSHHSFFSLARPPFSRRRIQTASHPRREESNWLVGMETAAREQPPRLVCGSFKNTTAQAHTPKATQESGLGSLRSPTVKDSSPGTNRACVARSPARGCFIFLPTNSLVSTRPSV